MPSPAGNLNTFLPAVTAGLIVDFSRDPSKYAVASLYKLSPVDRMIGRFPKIRPQELGRMLDADNRRWADGATRTITDFNKTQFDWVTYTTERYQEAIPYGYQGVDQADFDIIKAQANQMANRAMLFRAKLFYTLLGTSGTYISTHTDTATNWGGGAWDAATTANQYIKKSLFAMARRIELTTLGAVKYTDLTLVVSPTVAMEMAASQEISEAFIQSQYAGGMITGKGAEFQNYGLPSNLYGMNVVVDPTAEVTTNINATGTATTAYVPSATEAYVIARPGELVNNAGIAGDFSSIHCFVYKNEEMLSEMIDDPLNKRKLVGLIDNIDMKVVANETLCRATAVVS